jgi:flagellar P-ring protein precursor FlgI
MHLKKTLVLCGLLLVCAAFSTAARAQERIKDIAVVQGVRGNQLVGYGLVVGLAGTGDGSNVLFTPQSVASMLQRFGVTISPANLQLKNVAAVMVTANLPAFVKNGSTIDVTVSSMGDAKSLQGGTLLQTPLQAANGQVYAVAQGSVSVGGFLAGGGSGGSVTQNHVTAGRIPGGALVEQDVPTTFAGTPDSLQITLNEPDFSTAARVAAAIKRSLPNGATGAHAMDAATVEVDFTPGTEPVSLIATLEDLPIQTDESVAKVVINERTGTVVMDGNIVVSTCAVAHGNLTVQIANDPVISQPGPLSKGKTVIAPRKIITAHQGDERLVPLPPSTTLDNVVRSLNALGVTPRDLISILQAMKEAGALHADVEVQ